MPNSPCAPPRPSRKPVITSSKIRSAPVAAGIAALDLIEQLDPYDALVATADAITDGLHERFAAAGLPATINRVESMFSVFFREGAVRTFDDAKAADHERYARFFHHLLERGVYLPPSGYELWVLGTEHGDAEIERILDAVTSFKG